MDKRGLVHSTSMSHRFRYIEVWVLKTSLEGGGFISSFSGRMRHCRTNPADLDWKELDIFRAHLV